MRAMSAPVLSHLDPEMLVILDDLRRGSTRTFGAGAGAFSLAISGTGTAGMEAAVANITAPGARVLVVVTGYFGDRLAQIFQRYGAAVTRVDVEWGRACDPAAVERALAAAPADIVAVVHAETSTGVLNPVQRRSPRSRRGRRPDGRRCGHVVCARCRSRPRLGHRRLLQLLAEGTRRAVGHGAAVVLGARAREESPVAKLLPRSGAARGLLGPPQVSPHDLRAARLRRARGAHRRRRRGARSALGASRAQPPRARRRARGARPVAAAAGRRAPLDAERGQGAGRHRRSRGAPAAARRVQHRDRRRPRAARRHASGESG